MENQTSLIQIKGFRDGLMITLGVAPWDLLRGALMTQIDERASFFSGARLVLDVGEVELRVAELAPLRDLLSERGITLWAVLSESVTTESTAQMLGLATRLSKPKPDAGAQVPEELNPDSALWLHRTIRSGTRIEYAGHVAIFGDVNAGAEIVAGGSVMVWGRLRGVVHAGADGNTEAVVCALDLSPTQLRIAGEVATTPKSNEKPHPEIVRIVEGHLVASPWQVD